MKQSVACICLMCIMIVLPQNLRAEELKFPTTKAEILQDLFDQPIEQEIDVEAVASQQGKRGLGGIVDDTPLPKVGASILFATNSAKIEAESLPLLRLFGEALTERGDAVLIVAGHTDSKGSDGYNLKLSEKRAQAVKDFFQKEYDIAADRLIVSAYGEYQPIESNETPEGRAKNRRVEFVRVK